MDCLCSVAVILKGSIKLLTKNWKFLSLTTTLSLLLVSTFFWIFRLIPSDSLPQGILFKLFSFSTSSSNNSPEFYTTILANVAEDLLLLAIVNVHYVISTFLIRFMPETAIVIVSATSYSGKTLSCKELMLKFVKSCARSFFTGFYTTLFEAGFYYLFVSAIASPLAMFSGTFVFPIAVLFAIVAYIFSLHLSVVWIMALVISVIEENCYGIEALGKAEGLVKGKRIQGFILSIGFNLLYLILFVGFKTIMGEKRLSNYITIFWLLLLNCLQMMLQLVAYTVLYFRCEESQGDEVELECSSSYTNLSPAPRTSLQDTVP